MTVGYNETTTQVSSKYTGKNNNWSVEINTSKVENTTVIVNYTGNGKVPKFINLK